MRAFVLCVLVVSVLCVCVCETVEVESHALGHCAAGQTLAKGRALENSTLYSAVFRWSNDRDTGAWDYETGGHTIADLLALFDVSGRDSAALECVRVNYSATINLPGVFSGLLSLMGVPHDIPLYVDKVVCYANDIMFEDAKITAPVVGIISMKARHAMYNDVDLVSTSHTVLTLPWYAVPFSSQTSAALDHSLQEKFSALSKTLCEAPEGGGALLRHILRPKLNQTFATEPLVAGTRVRKFPLRSKTAPEALTLGRVGLRRMEHSTSAPEVWV
jgi:hypothetical protein